MDGRLDVDLERWRTPIRIARRLTSRPEGQITRADGRGKIGAIGPCPAYVGLMTRDVFKNVYALDPGGSAWPRSRRAWQHVQDRVLGGSSYDFLRPSREIVSALDAERRRLWRPDRRGRPEAREIAVEIREFARQPSRGKPATLRRLKRIDDRIDGRITADLEKNNPGELQRIELGLERDATLAPLVRRADRMHQLNIHADELVPKGVLPDETPERRTALAERLEELAETNRAHQREIEAREQVIQIDEPTRRLLNARVAIERQDRELALAQANQDRIDSMNAELQRRDGALRELAVRALVSERVDSEAGDAILGLSVAELRGRLSLANEARRKLEAATEALRSVESERARLEQSLAASESTPSRADADERLRELREIEMARRIAAHHQPARSTLPMPILAALGLSGVVALVTGLAIGGQAGTLLAILGAGTLAAVINAFVTRRRSAAAPRADWQSRLRGLDLDTDADIAAEIAHSQAMRDAALQRELDVERLARAQETETVAREVARNSETEFQAVQADFLAVIAEVPVAPIHRQAPDDGLVRDLEEMRQSIRDTQRLRSNRDDVGKRLAAWRAEGERLRQTLALELPTDPFEAVPAALRFLRDALEVERAATDAAAELPELREVVETCGREREAAVLELERIDASLTALDPGGADPTVGLDRFRQALKLRAEAGRVLSDLERDDPGWRERVTEAEELVAAGETVGLSDSDRVALRLRAEELRAEGQDLAAEKGQRTTERNRLTGEPGPAHIMGAIQAAEEHLDFVRREHDRLALLRQVVLMAEHSYRERYQAPLLTAAGRHLRHFTGGRYDLLTVDDAASGEVKLQVRRTGEDFPQNVDTPLSRGTIQQIYFALRLAMVDLVEGDEPLPLFLDEMFVNWDPGRTTSGLAALADMPGDRQVFLFTADPFWAERAIKDVPAHIVRTPTV